MHRLLRRQLVERGFDPDELGPLAELMADVSASYGQADEDRESLQQLIELGGVALQRVTEELTTLLQAVPDLFLRIDDAGVVIDRRGGRQPRGRFARGPIPSDKLSDHLTERARVAYESALPRVCAGEGSASVDLVYDDAEVYELRLFPLAGHHAMAVIRDVTERERHQALSAAHAREAARSEALSQFAYVASHDLRQPLRAIDNLAQWIEEDLGDALQGSAKQHLELLRARARRMDLLLSDLLEYSRVGRKEAKVEHVDAGELIAGVIDMLSPPSGFVVDVQSAMPRFDTARSPLERVLLNLVGNAIKHHDQDVGRIEIACEDAGECFRFTVRDDGPGIPMKFRERAFEMFQTLERRDEVEGSGMGLALIKRIVASAGGQITLTDNAPRGCLFRFTWPKSWRDQVRDSFRPTDA